MVSSSPSPSPSPSPPPLRLLQLPRSLHPLLCLLCIFVFNLVLAAPLPLNITAALSAHPDLSDFACLLASTSVPAELAARSSLTLLAVPNLFLRRSYSAITRNAAGPDIADVLRYHVLLEYLSWSDLRRIPAGSGRLVTTLFQTTGRASGNLGSINLTRAATAPEAGGGADSVITARSPAPFSPSNATFLALVETVPYNVSIFAIDALLLPSGFDLAASETRPPPAGLNITHVLVDAHGFNVAASMLEASGVAEELEADEHGAGITIFVPTDEAFAGLPATERLQSLPADRKAVVLRFHVLDSYYPLGSLESIVNPVQPTLATEDAGAGRFTLNITRVNGSVAIDTGLVQASITRTVFDQNPVAVFAVSRVLLPREIFGGGGREKEGLAAAPPPFKPGGLGLAPEGADGGLDSPPALLSSPPGFVENLSYGVAAADAAVGALICISMLYLQLYLV